MCVCVCRGGGRGEGGEEGEFLLVFCTVPPSNCYVLVVRLPCCRRWSWCFFFFQYVLSLSDPPLGVIDTMLCSVIVALPGHPLSIF